MTARPRGSCYDRNTCNRPPPNGRKSRERRSLACNRDRIGKLGADTSVVLDFASGRWPAVVGAFRSHFFVVQTVAAFGLRKKISLLP
jgi:hypothetical protein